MADQVDNTQNPLIPPPKKDELPSADPHKFKQVMKELSTDTEQKGKWKPQKDQEFREEGVSATDDTEEAAPPFVSEDGELGPTTQAGSSVSSAQGPGAAQPAGENEDFFTAPPVSEPGASKAAEHKKKEDIRSSESMTTAGKAGALDKQTVKGGLAGVPEKWGEKDKDEAAAMGGAAVPTPAPHEIVTAAEKEKVKRKTGSSTAAEMGTQQPSQQPVIAPPLTSLAPAAYTQMMPQLQEFFQKLIGVLTVMKASGVSETVIQLNAPVGSRLSIFNGSEISIKEYSSAPKSFNIQFNGNPEAVNLVQGNLGSLMAAFNDKEYNFRVNRFEIGLISRKDEPLFKRKGPISEDDAG